MLAYKAGWCQLPRHSSYPAGAEYQHHCGRAIGPVLLPIIPWDLDGGVERSGAAKRRGKGWW